MSANSIADQRGLPTEALIRTLRNELEWIPLKAMRKEPSHRYQSADQFGEDIANYLAGQPLLAGPESKTYRLQKFIFRHRWQTAASIALAVSLLAGTIGTSVMAARRGGSRVCRRTVWRCATTSQHLHVRPLSPDPQSARINTGRQSARANLPDLFAEARGSIELAAQDDLWLDIASAYNRLGDIQGKPGQGNLVIWMLP